VAQSRSLELELRRERRASVTNPVWARAADGTIESVGTALFFAHRGRKFVVTAAHMLRNHIKQQLFVFVGQVDISLNRRWFRSLNEDMDDWPLCRSGRTSPRIRPKPPSPHAISATWPRILLSSSTTSLDIEPRNMNTASRQRNSQPPARSMRCGLRPRTCTSHDDCRQPATCCAFQSSPPLGS